VEKKTARDRDCSTRGRGVKVMARARSKSSLRRRTTLGSLASAAFLVTILAGAFPGSIRGAPTAGFCREAGQNAPAAADCGYFNETVLSDPAGDAEDPDVNILSLTLRQWGEALRFDLVTNGSDFDAEDADIVFSLLFDLDRNPSTGRHLFGLGVEMELWIWTELDGISVLSKYTAAGDIASEDWGGPRVRFKPNGLDFQLDASLIGEGPFDLYFGTLGGDPFSTDDGPASEVALEPSQPSSLRISAESLVLADHPRTIRLPHLGSAVQLHTLLTSGGIESEVPPGELTYEVDHPTIGAVPDPEAIVSIDGNGVAHYNSEGFILARAVVDACDLVSDPVIIANGDLYGDPTTDDVLAIFRSDFAPGNHTFGDMMETYPGYIPLVNTAYRATRDMYGGWEPLGGDTQIFALLDLPGYCGGAGNPLQTGPCCYTNCGNGEPQLEVVIHEMGHNYQYAPGMWRFLTAGWRFVGANVHECVASLPVIYFANEVSLHGGQYGFGPGTWEKSHFDEFVSNDGSEWSVLDDFETKLSSGEVSGFFDPEADLDTIALFCGFFQSHIYGHLGDWTPFGHEMIRRFVNVFDGGVLPGFQDDKVESYFAAAFSAAAGLDLRDRLRHWGFTIDDGFYEQVFPLVLGRIPQVFSDGFESGDFSKWGSPALRRGASRQPTSSSTTTSPAPPRMRSRSRHAEADRP